ncbi:hypothetical protein C84B14_04409 [Salinisphaera sp. C84B14]
MRERQIRVHPLAELAYRAIHPASDTVSTRAAADVADRRRRAQMVIGARGSLFAVKLNASGEPQV